MYADDVKIFTPVRNDSDCVHLQMILENLDSWCSRNALQVCADKCQCISFSRARYPISFTYTMLNTALVRTTCIRDLGVLLDHKMSFRPHIDSVVAKGNQLLGLITRTCNEFTDLMCVKSIFCAIVRSCLEYCWKVIVVSHTKQRESCGQFSYSLWSTCVLMLDENPSTRSTTKKTQTCKECKRH